MHHIVYKTTRQSTGEYYIGVHSTHNINDTYMGSGDRIKRLITKYGKSDFVRITLVECTTRADALKREADILTNEVLNDPLCLNITVGGKGNPAGGHGISDDARAKLRLIHLGKSKSEETRKRISESKKGIPSPLKGASRSMEIRNRISAGLMGRVVSDSTKEKISRARTGQPRSPETIEKIRAASKAKRHTEETKARMRGRVFECVVCPHCGKSGGKPHMVRWHFDNCKIRLNSST